MTFYIFKQLTLSAAFVLLAGVSASITTPFAYAANKTTATVSSNEIQEIFWDDLMPIGFEPEQSAVDHDATDLASAQMSLDAPVVDSLNGKTVKIPGFVVPLEGNDTHVTEFLLVPFFGACIHVPPPPPNQIIHVKYPKGAAVDSLYDAVVLTGKISTKGWKGDIAQVGYTMEGITIAPYDE
ncbi:DUF3299 domain-containing protein [Flocculibacter collagenilyticus]|uniref:DUF3299 domain-containing protein n=1 Tax=Flocculibacter collagenilyticus TaxID=2744479 RepID=UPI0018F3273C|nr:DUF3299 domain-containing protein [Flocculibacter collagenilyticus]